MDPNVIRDPREKLSMKRPIDFIIRQGSAWLDGPEADQIDEEVWSLGQWIETLECFTKRYARIDLD